MGFVLSVLYFVTYYLTPVMIFGPLAEARIELILAAALLLISLPRIMNSVVTKTPQSLALIGLAIGVLLSLLFGQHWVTGAVQAFLGFIPNAYGYFMVGLYCNSMKKLRVLVLMMLFVCLFVIGHGASDLARGIPESSLAPGVALGAPVESGPTASPYILKTMTSPTEWNYRLRGLGEINDPNDFGQLTICTIPLVFIFWRPRKAFLNLLCVLVPVAVLLYGLFLTHSRGALLALVALVLVAGWRRLGTVPALVLGGALFAGAMAMNFTGGRDISADAGADRTALWGDSLQALKGHPIFGVGFGFLSDYTGSHHTAHNSVAVCSAELGMFGLYFWSLFLFPSVRDTFAIASPSKVGEGEAVVAEEELYLQAARKVESYDKAEINRLGRLLLLSLVGFLAAGWFLSRAFVMTFFLLGGMTEVVYEMALQRGMIVPRLRLARAAP